MAGQGLKRLVRPSRPTAATEERREICLDGRAVAYVLRRSARRTFALQVGDRGVRAAVPHRAREEEVERFIEGHARWLIGKIAAREERAPSAPFEIRDGAMFPLLGEHCRLRLDGVQRSPRWRAGVDGVEELVIGAALDPRAALVRALRKRALPWFAERLAEYCFRLGRPVPRLALSSARTRWGSCSARSGIRLHWRLIHLPPALIDYVVAHEVAHLVEMNHSPRFWDVVAGLYPGWKTARAGLRAAAPMLPPIAAGGAALNED